MRYDIFPLPSQNQSDRLGRPELIVIHGIGLPLEDCFEGLTHPVDCGKGLGVSAHYFIPQQSAAEILSQFPQLFPSISAPSFPHLPPVISLVPEGKKAYHAGKSHWKDYNSRPGCSQGLNDCSVGIEFHAPGYGKNGEDWFHFTPYSDLQIQVGIHLLKDIVNRWGIASHDILAHSDIAPYFPGEEGSPPRYKTDPGPLFPWDQLGKAGLGNLPLALPPLESLTQEFQIRELLQQIGYDISLTPGDWGVKEEFIWKAFQMHYGQSLPNHPLNKA